MIRGFSLTLLFTFIMVSFAGCTYVETPKTPKVPVAESLDPEPGPIIEEDDGDTYRVKFETSQGDFVIDVHPAWAPIGAAHFKELVEAQFYDDCRFFRVIEGFMAQVGMNGDPAVHKKWMDKTIQDEPVKKQNLRGYVTYAKTGAPNSRSTQFFINFSNNSNLDSMQFSPFGIISEGMDVVDSLYNGYGEGAPRGKGPDQSRIMAEGNQYLKADFPKLDYIKTARILTDEEKTPDIQPKPTN